MSTDLKSHLKIGSTFAALIVTCFAWLMVNIDLLYKAGSVVKFKSEFQIVSYPIIPWLIELILFGFVANFLLYGGAVFILTRLGHLRRSDKHRSACYTALKQIYHQPSPPALSILVPSYKEEPQVVKRTLLSAALLEYPQRRVVLLIDDPPEPESSADQELLAAARQLPKDVAALLLPAARKLSAASQSFEDRLLTGSVDVGAELLRLAHIYQAVALWFEEQARQYPAHDHEARFFVKEILERPARAHRQHARDILSLILEERSLDDVTLLRVEYRRLASLFKVEMDSFERKQFDNLSHEANKAMNLNSYIGLIGSEWRPVRYGGRVKLHVMPPGRGTLCVPDAQYIITLDADSMLMHDYALRLTHEMDKQGCGRLAIVQTPYSAFPGTSNSLEKTAGAQTDLQYVVHQGFTQHQATFWVGANALLRKKALDDIVVYEEERGHIVKKYIQDRTVIEDTESSIDLVERGWQLVNYPARLAFSATPPDFGSLLIQRRRWANGGLIIFPKMARHVLRGPGRLRKMPEAFLRTHYLISTAMTNLGLLILILISIDSDLVSPWFILSLAVYFFVYTLSLKESGYQGRDLFRVMSLNMLLVPVNLAGAIKSIQQAITKKRVPFSRTPKVEHRTASPAWLILFEIVLMAFCFLAAIFYLMDHNWLSSGFAALNGLILFYGITIFIGWREAIEDSRIALPKPILARKSRILQTASRLPDAGD